MLATLSLLIALAPPHAHFAPQRTAAPSRAAVVVAAAATPETQEALINKLRSANAAQLPALLGDNMGAVDQRLFLRLAELSDAASDDAERDAISQLASTVATVVEDLLNQAEQQLDADAQNAQALLQAATSASGEFDVPIPPERAEAVRAAVQQRLGALDEGFVATVSAYMKKAGDDNMEGLVELLREVLQIFAAEKLLATIEASLAADKLGVVGRYLHREIDRIKTVAGVIDDVAERISQRVQRLYRRTEDFEQVRAGKIDMVAEQTMSLRGKNTLMTSEELVKVDVTVTIDVSEDGHHLLRARDRDRDRARVRDRVSPNLHDRADVPDAHGPKGECELGLG